MTSDSDSVNPTQGTAILDEGIFDQLRSRGSQAMGRRILINRKLVSQILWHLDEVAQDSILAF